MDTGNFDLVVIGAGPGGYTAAIRAAQLGWKVACIEKEPQLGGTCLRIGCIPSKALLESSERFHQIQSESSIHGIQISSVQVNLQAMMDRKSKVVNTLAQGIDGLLKKNKVTRLPGIATFLSPTELQVASSTHTQTVQSRYFLIATGSVSASLPGITLDGKQIGDSTSALSYSEIPKHLVVIGAGAIGLELGSVWKRLGSRVTVLEYLPRILPGMDQEIALEAQKILTGQGLEFQLGVQVTGAETKGTGCLVHTKSLPSIECDRVLVAVGRKPNTEGLGLENLSIQTDRRGAILVNERFETAIPNILAVGDVIPGPMLAHKAEEEGIACVEHLISGFGKVHYETIPAIVYTEPEVAAVGATEEQLKENKIQYRKGVFSYRANGRAHALGHTQGKAKILSDATTDRILGVHIIGHSAGDLIAEAATAMTYHASSEDLARVCHAHPTLSEILKEAALDVDKRAIHS